MKFTAGDRVRPLPGEVMALQGEQTVIATYSHPVTGEWLWLVNGYGVVRSFCADFWEHVREDAGEGRVNMDLDRIAGALEKTLRGKKES